MSRRRFVFALVTLIASPWALPQPVATLHRIGVITKGAVDEPLVESLRAGLRDGGLAEGKHYVLHVRKAGGDLDTVGEAARALVNEKVELLFTINTSVSVAALRATTDVPIVFYAGSDPVRAGLVASLAKPGGRATGVHFPDTGKRLEVVQLLLPKARRVITFYNPQNSVARASVATARAAAGHLGIELIERHVANVTEYVAAVRALKRGEVDAYVVAGDAMIAANMPAVVELLRERRLPAFTQQLEFVETIALASYGSNPTEAVRIAAGHVKRILAGAKPGDLPVNVYDRVELTVNLRIADELGIPVPETVLLRAARVIR
jgi:putative ABC transport system substrate-binding protein